MPLEEGRFRLVAAAVILEGIRLLEPVVVRGCGAFGPRRRREEMDSQTVEFVGIKPRQHGDIEAGKLVAAIDVMPLVVGHALLMQQVDDGLHAGRRNHFGHHDDVGSQRLDHRRHAFEVPAAGRLETEAGEPRILAGNGKILGVEAGDPQHGGRRPGRRSRLGFRRRSGGRLVRGGNGDRHAEHDKHAGHERQDKPGQPDRAYTSGGKQPALTLGDHGR